MIQKGDNPILIQFDVQLNALWLLLGICFPNSICSLHKDRVKVTSKEFLIPSLLAGSLFNLSNIQSEIP
jgi:hypothetical protein